MAYTFRFLNLKAGAFSSTNRMGRVSLFGLQRRSLRVYSYTGSTRCFLNKKSSWDPKMNGVGDAGDVIKPQKHVVPPKGENDTLGTAAIPEVLEKLMSPFKGWSDVQAHDLTAKTGWSVFQPLPTHVDAKTQTGLEGETTLNLTQLRYESVCKIAHRKKSPTPPYSPSGRWRSGGGLYI